MSTVRYTFRYCRHVSRKQGESVRWRSYEAVSSEPGLAWQFELEHRDFPGWAFTIGVTPAGVPAGFRMTPIVEMPERDPATGRFGGMSYTAWLDRWHMDPDAPALTARMLRSVPLGELQAFAHGLWIKRVALTRRSLERLDGRPGNAGLTEKYRAIVGGMELRPGRRGRGDHEYAALAALYVEALAQGHGVPWLANEMHLSTSAVRNQLYEARRRRLLSEAPKGRSGGELTDRALTVLEQEGR